MGKKKNRYIVYNIDSDQDTDSPYYDETLSEGEQRLRVLHDRKKRKGKTVTLVTGFIGTEDDLNDIARMLKSKCGVGGSVKDGEILIQGALKDKVYALLLDAGFVQTKTSGG